MQRGLAGVGAWKSDVWRLKSRLDARTSTFLDVERTAVSRTNSVITRPATAGVSRLTANPSPDHPSADDNSLVPHTSPVK